MDYLITVKTDITMQHVTENCKHLNWECLFCKGNTYSKNASSLAPRDNFCSSVGYPKNFGIIFIIRLEENSTDTADLHPNY